MNALTTKEFRRSAVLLQSERTSFGKIPRDRNGTFEPQIIEKRQTRTDDIETRVLAMYQTI